MERSREDVEHLEQRKADLEVQLAALLAEKTEVDTALREQRETREADEERQRADVAAADLALTGEDRTEDGVAHFAHEHGWSMNWDYSTTWG